MKIVLFCIVFTVTSVVVTKPLEIISSNTTLYVSPLGDDEKGNGSDVNPWFSPHRALKHLNGYWISPDAKVKILAKEGRYLFSSLGPITVNHPNGANISIEGEGEVIFDWSENSSNNGIVVRKGFTLGFLNGIKLTGDGENGRGILADGGSVIYCGEDIVVEHFERGIVAANNSYINAQHVHTYHNARWGLLATHRSYILCNYAVSDSNEIGAGIDDGSYLYAHYASMDNNRKIGFWARNSGKGYARESTASNNGEYGYRMERDSFIMTYGAEAHGNGIEDFSPNRSTEDPPNFGNGGSWISSTQKSE
jgi:hypothetical protein